MKIKTLAIFILLFALVGGVSALPFTINNVEVNGVEVSENSVTKLSVERGSEMTLKVTVTPSEGIKNFEVKAFISGFEYNDEEDLRVEDVTEVDNLEAGITYVKQLKLKLSDLIESGNYKLRLIFSGSGSDDLVRKNYNINIDLPRHALKVEDVVFYPSEKVKAGHALLTSVRVENKGEKDEQDVKVIVSIPKLGLSTSDYLEEIETGDEEEETEELYLRLDKCTPAGVYPVTIDVSFDNSHRKVDQIIKIITVEANEACGSMEKTGTVNFYSKEEKITRGASTAFLVTISNTGRTQQSFTATVDAPKGLSITVRPSSTVLLNPGASHTFNILATADKNAPLGATSLNVRLNSGDLLIEELALTANINEEEESNKNLRGLLEIGLLVLVVLLIVIGLIVGLSRLRSKNEEYY